MGQGGFIYALGAEGSPHVKIGSTKGSVERRMKILQTGHPAPLYIIARVEVATNLRRVEKRIHALIQAVCQYGEWFDIALDVARLEALVAEALYALTQPDPPKARVEPMQPIHRLGNRIQQLREKRGMSVQELADRAGTTYQSIWRIERGEQKDPSVALMRGIARALGVGVDHLINMFGDKDSEARPTARELVAP